MTTIFEVRQALSDAVDTIPGLRSVPYVPRSLDPPMAIISDRGGVDYDLVLGRGADVWKFVVSVYVSAESNVQAQELIETFQAPAGASSVKTAIESNAGLAALVDYARVKVVGPTHIETVSGNHLVAEFDVEIVF